MREEARRIIDIKRTANPFKSYLWYVELPSDIGEFTGDVWELNGRISSISTPYHNFETGKEIDGNSFWYFAKSIDIGSITLEIVEHEDGMSFEYFKQWQQLINNDNGTFNPPFHYKRDLKFFRLDSGKTKILYDKYTGYFISGISDVANDYETNGLVKFTVTLTGDNVERIELNSEHTQQTNKDEFFSKVNQSRDSKTSLLDLLI